MGNEGRFLCRTASLPASACTSRHEKRRRFSACTASLDFWTIHGLSDSMLYALHGTTLCRTLHLVLHSLSGSSAGPRDSRHAPDSCFLSQYRRHFALRFRFCFSFCSSFNPASGRLDGKPSALRVQLHFHSLRSEAECCPLSASDSASSPVQSLADGQKWLQTAFRAFGRDAQIRRIYSPPAFPNTASAILSSLLLAARSSWCT